MKIGIVGVSGYGGSELLRLCAGHPAFQLAYAGGESTAGQTLAQRFPGLIGHPAGKLTIQPFERLREAANALYRECGRASGRHRV